MDVCSTGDKAISEDTSRFCQLSADQSQSTCKVTGDLSSNDLGNSLTEFLKIQDDKNSASGYIQPSDKDAITNMQKEAKCEDSHKSKLASVNAETKCATFPSSDRILLSTASKTAVDEEGKEEGVVKLKEDDPTAEVLAENYYSKNDSPPFPRSISLPAPLKLVSAMKGSREKRGTPPKKVTVSWAPDVYDPIPSSKSHVPANKPQRHSKKKGKNKQKGNGKTSRGSRVKDKKQAQKYGSSSNRSFKFLADDDRMVDRDEPKSGTVDFNIGSPDPFCGHSFLQQSVAKLHFSVAEAT